MSDTPDLVVDNETKTNVVVKKPSKYNVIMFNDDFTTMEFVVWVLENVFDKTKIEAETLMRIIDQSESAIVGTYKKEIAEQKVYDTMQVAEINNFPLRAEIRKVED